MWIGFKAKALGFVSERSVPKAFALGCLQKPSSFHLFVVVLAQLYRTTEAKNVLFALLCVFVFTIAEKIKK